MDEMIEDIKKHAQEVTSKQDKLLGLIGNIVGEKAHKAKTED